MADWHYPKKGTAGHALQNLADLSREHDRETRAYGVQESDPDHAHFTFLIEGRKFEITAESW
jgi:hypothetical protein